MRGCKSGSLGTEMTRKTASVFSKASHVIPAVSKEGYTDYDLVA